MTILFLLSERAERDCLLGKSTITVAAIFCFAEGKAFDAFNTITLKDFSGKGGKIHVVNPFFTVHVDCCWHEIFTRVKITGSP